LSPANKYILISVFVLAVQNKFKLCMQDSLNVEGLLYIENLISWIRVWFIVFNATFNNILAILWRSVLMVDEIRVHRENH